MDQIPPLLFFRIQAIVSAITFTSAVGRLHRPIRAAAGLDGDEIEPGYKILVLGKIEFPERKEILANVHALQAAVGAVNKPGAGLSARVLVVPEPPPPLRT